jgi:hypothetical protein
LVELAKQRYRDLLRAEPQDWDARYNLERALRARTGGTGERRRGEQPAGRAPQRFAARHDAGRPAVSPWRRFANGLGSRQNLPIVLAATLLAVAVWLPPITLQRSTYQYLVTFDVTQSMEVDDQTVAGAAVIAACLRQSRNA